MRKVEVALGQAYRYATHVRRFDQALRTPLPAQHDKLMQVIKANENTAFGQKHNFAKINSISDYQSLVPPNTYEDLQPYIERVMNGRRGQLTNEDVVMFATTSGTTGKPKYIPITPSHLKDYTHAFQVQNYKMIVDYPGAPLGTYMIFSSNDEEGRTAAGIPFGSVSGLLRQRQSSLVQKYFALPHQVSRIKDVEVKYYVMLRLALCQDVSAILGCNPSSMLLLADQMQERAEELISDIAEGTLRKAFMPPPAIAEPLSRHFVHDRVRAQELQRILDKHGRLTPELVWPNMAMLSCWKGGPMSFYLDRLPAAYGDLPIRDFGYMASEGRGTISISHQGAGGVVALTCHFFEFVPENEKDSPNPTFLTVDQLELGGRYYIYFTTSSGLYRYDINDLIEVEGFEYNTPVIRFVQKGMGVSSVTGEKITEEQVQVALQYALRMLNLSGIEHFTFAVEMDYPPHYVCFAEVKQDLPDSVVQEFLRVFEQSLQLQNIEYKDKRATKRLGSPKFQKVPNGTFTRLRQHRVSAGAPEAQVKIPLLNAGVDFYHTLATIGCVLSLTN
ncbi:MAG: GH3 auxin-responsive promoter family protein [Candidatus Obscuribacterales bacterium]